jgi:hypothetical protein
VQTTVACALPKVISDRGMAFTSGLFCTLLRLLDVAAWRTTAYHLQANPVERYHQPLMKALRAGIAHEWPQLLSVTQLVLNSAMLKQTGFSPLELAFGHSADAVAFI